ncbi:MAG: Helix-turn-helix domain [Acidimicrobiales bacterium]|nr:Helix-turn-helix domain [Acidimicrobiales bacterium]
MNESERWVEFGRFLREQRDKLGISRREAAKRSKVPEGTWKDLETGRKTGYGGVRVLPNPGADVLDKIAGALELEPQELNRHVGRLNNKQRPGASGGPKDAGSPLVQKIARLGDRDRQLIESLVEEMLERE